MPIIDFDNSKYMPTPSSLFLFFEIMRRYEFIAQVYVDQKGERKTIEVRKMPKK
jgi:hypothetical protein